ncbi:hypothetical protein ACIBG0_38820 [Nocardia sp. NPDC050630]|uniref:hypothetical protein n=1 Tax=Nocardia sp. NPDC050630 TaxID=3364321 RepID=UPI0037B2C5B5
MTAHCGLTTRFKLSEPPDTYLGVVVPEDVKAVWSTWDGVEWRRWRHYNRGDLYLPDQRFSVRLPAGMCVFHRDMWLRWRNRFFSGRTWFGDGFRSAYMAAADAWDHYRNEWDEKTIEQMRAVEESCLSGRSKQCAGQRICRKLPEAA